MDDMEVGVIAPRQVPLFAGSAGRRGRVRATFLVSQSVLSREHLGTSLHQPGVARAVQGSALFLTAVGLLGLGLGALLRNTAGAIASLFGVLFGLQIVVGFLPASVADKVSRYLPTPAGRRRHQRAARPGVARSLGRVRPVLPVRGDHAGAGRLAAAPP